MTRGRVFYGGEEHIENYKPLKAIFDTNPEIKVSVCRHDKVFSNYILPSLPAKYPWICKKCGEKGTDVRESLQINEYDEILKKFNTIQ